MERQELETLVRKIVTECLNEERNRMLLNEMSFNRNVFKDKVGDLSQQILENWCLIRYCTLRKNMEDLKKHWMSELKGHLLSVMRFKLKGDDKYETRLKVIKEIWNEYEYFNTYNLDITIRHKFEEENVDTINDTFYNEVIKDCIEYGNEDLIEIIAMRDANEIYDYINTI